MVEINLRHYAYLGDAVWELWVRERTIYQTQNSKDLHKLTTEKVNMGFQGELLRNLESVLTNEEIEILRRARNLSVPVARRTTQSEYRLATAFEALLGWWYLNDKTRLNEIFGIIENKYV